MFIFLKRGENSLTFESHKHRGCFIEDIYSALGTDEMVSESLSEDERVSKITVQVSTAQ